MAVRYNCPVMGDVSGEECTGCFAVQKLEDTNKSQTRAACVADVQAVKRIVEAA